MKGKLKKAIKETFLFPETIHKEEFFRQVEGGSVSKKEYRCIAPVILRFTAAAAAAAVSLGVWGSMKFNPVTDKRDYDNGTVIETTEYSENTIPSVTTSNSNGSTITVTTVHNDGSVYIETTVNNSGENPIVTTAVNNCNAFTVTTANNGGSTDVTTAEALHNESSGQITAVITSSPIAEERTLPAVTDSGAVPIETTVSAVHGTTTPQSEGTLPSISTPIYVPTPDITNERSYYMKKFASFTTAVTILASSSGLNAFAEYQPPQITAEDQKLIDYIEQNVPDLDLNCDGEINARDVYTAFLYALNNTSMLSEEIKEKCSESEFTNVKGYQSFARYYLLTYGIKPEEFIRSYYKINGKMSVSGKEDSFVHWLKRTADEYDLGYQALCEKVNDGEISLDFNDDGKTNILDAYDYYYYDYYQTQNAYQSIISGNSDYPLSTWLNCIYFDSIKPDGVEGVNTSCSINDDYYVVVKYFLYNSQITEDMFENDIYIAHYNNFQAAANFKATLKTMAKMEGIVPPDENEINDELFWQYYDVCEAEFNSGERALPDVDLNGVIDYEDYFTSNIFFGDRLNNTSCEDSILPVDVWNNFNENCDFNGNGISGDVYDTTIVQIYVLKSGVEEPEDFDTAYQEYVKRLTEAKSITADYETTVQTGASYSLSTSYDRSYDLLCSTDIERSGDANNDNEVNIADAVAIAKVYTYPEKYQLTSKGRFNADIYNTGDGVTAEDGEAMQKQLLGK